MLVARQHTLEAARDRMDAMLSAKRQLEVEVENLQARLAAVEVAHASSDLCLDDSQLSNTRQLLDDIRTRIDVQEEMLSVNSQYDGGIPLETDEESDKDIMKEITAYFAAPASEIELADVR